MTSHDPTKPDAPVTTTGPLFPLVFSPFISIFTSCFIFHSRA
jgi:hypothetical protein